jgi:hypothetical protein
MAPQAFPKRLPQGTSLSLAGHGHLMSHGASLPRRRLNGAKGKNKGMMTAT